MKKLFFFLLLSGGVALLAFWPGRSAEKVTLSVTTGMNARDIARQLVEERVLLSRYPFLVWVRVRLASASLHVGRYQFKRDRAAFWIVDDLIRGRTETVHLTVPEGFASWQIGERLEQVGIGTKEQFLQVVKADGLEGFLFPATYDLSAALTSKEAARVMSEEFDRRWTSDFEARAQAIHMGKRDVVTLASIIEREIRVRDELPQVAAVYHNRLKIRMKLDADPTVQYAFGYWKTNLTYDDYHNTKSPYNTYLRPGLPPGPISNPGLDAIRAALWPAESNALYFVAQEDGRHTFSVSYREHTNKVNKRNRERKAKKAMLRKPT